MDINLNISNINKIISETIFLAKNLDDFIQFKNPESDYKIICSHGSKQSIYKFPRIFVHEKEIGIRRYSTSYFFEKEIFNYTNLVKSLKSSRNIWSYQAYPWTNDLRFLKKNVFAIDYFLYLKLSNKFTQLDYLSLNGSSELKEHIKQRNSLLNTKFDLGIIKINNPTVLCKSSSDGGEGLVVLKNDDQSNFFSNGILRCETFIQHKYSFNQIGVVFNDGVAKYPPSLQILDENLGYMGSSFDIENLLSNESLKDITLITNLVGQAILKQGYRGMFGCDYIVTEDNQVLFIELNPRYQASSMVLNLLDWGNKEYLSPHFLHIASFLTSKISLDLSYKDESLIPMPNSKNLSYIKLKHSPEKLIKSNLLCLEASNDVQIEKGANKLTVFGTHKEIMQFVH